MSLADEIFVPCTMHETFNDRCHACLVASVAELCRILEGDWEECQWCAGKGCTICDGEGGYEVTP